MLRNRVYIALIDVPDFNVSTRGDFEPLISGELFYPGPSDSVGPCAEHRTSQARASGLPAARLRPRDVRQAADGDLVEGPQRLLRLLHQAGVGTARHAAGVPALPAERLVHRRLSEAKEMVDQMFTSWNHLVSWLHHAERLRAAA